MRGYEKDGTAYLNTEDTARGLGFTTVATSGNIVVRWNTVHKYLTDFGVATSCNGDYQAHCPEFIPENIFYRLAMKAKNEVASILVGDLAKLLKQNGVEIGANRLFEWLRNNGYLIKGERADKNMPTQKSMEMNLFEVKERTINNPDGSVRITRTPKVTGKGQIYFVDKLIKKFVA